MTVPRFLSLLSALSLLMTPVAAQAYLGPGVGLGVLGVVLGIFGSILLGLASILWYPVKRLLRRARAGKARRGS